MRENGYCIYEVLDKIRARPGMYIGEERLSCLDGFLSGYNLAMGSEGKEDISVPRLHGFHEWVRNELAFREATPGWANMILASVLDLDPKKIGWDTYWIGVTPEQHRQSLQKFYELLDRYRAENT